MTSMQRLGAVLAGDKPDRPPYGLVCGSMGAALSSCELDDYYRDPKLYAKGQAAICAKLDPDILFSPFLFAYEAAAFGAKLAKQARSVPNVAKPPYRSVEEALAAPLPSLREDSYLRFLIEATEATADMAQGRRIVAAPITSPIDLPALLIGIEAWLDALLFKPELAALLSERATEHFVSLGSAFLAAGAAMLASPVMFANPSILDEASAKRLTLPILRDAFGRLPGPIVFHHGGNAIAEHIGLYAGLPNVAGFLLSERDSFSAARAVVGSDTILMGNISGPHFDAYSPERLKQKLDELIEDRSGDHRWIFCNSSAELPSWTPPENLAIVREAFQRGGY
ncbi:MAG TPA: uroporphyrinogen decarboxylase [Spirochaetaceae bacterium]|jgi:uroporphyrinogen decarboxylase|nr:uroporphyrinogen decarboxylase [Spirochaetaceae bacterium]